MSAFWKNILDVLFPPKCVFCRRPLGVGESGLCCSCAESLPYARNDGSFKTDFVNVVAAPFYYDGRVRESLLRYKFDGETGYAGVYGRLLAGCVREHLAGGYDLISWVPLSQKRLKTRGYDQAMLIAMAMALELDSVAVETLHKDAEIAPQSATGDAAARRANISGAYSVPDTELVEGKRILLVDDIVTTGSTLSECARVLGLAGAQSVCAVCVAMSKQQP